MTHDYGQFSPRDFVLDDAFRRWVFEPDEPDVTFWRTFLLRHPHQQAAVDEAVSLLLHLRARQDDLTHASQQRIWQVLERAASTDRPSEPAVRTLPVWLWGIGSWRLAASLTGALLLTGGAVWYALQPKQQRIHTAFGETRSVTLPDGSTVLLNGNSTLTFADEWSTGAPAAGAPAADAKPREVWLDGEAFFKVAKVNRTVQQDTGGAVKFVTHTPGLDITVLGTQFNVNTRRGNTDVTLVEGRVQLTKVGAVRPQTVEMKPGQFASAQPDIERVEVRAEKPQLHTSWTQRQFVFDDTPLSAIAEQLRDTYGLELVFEDSELANRRFTGNLTNESIETLLTTLSLTFNLTVQRDGRRIVLQHNA